VSLCEYFDESSCCMLKREINKENEKQKERDKTETEKNNGK
jgi:hypothetical protein